MTLQKNQMNRRSFISKMGYGLGTVGFIGATSPFRTFISPDNSGPGTVKKLFATTDYTDNVLINNSLMSISQLDDLHRGLAEMGVTRHQWIHDSFWGIDEEYPHGFDILAEAVQSAHAHGIEFYALLKPFEGGGFSFFLPHSMPFNEDSVAFKDLRGICPIASKYASEHPEMNLKRKPGTYEFDTVVKAIRLVKWNDAPTRIREEHLSIFTSPTNNEFVPYHGDVSFRETVEWRFRFPKWRRCRIIHLENLNIPAEHRYILIKSLLADGGGDFRNEKGNIIELIGANDEVIPHTLSTGPVDFETHDKALYQSRFMKQLVPYLRSPAVHEEMADEEKLRTHYENFYNFGRYELTDWMSLDGQGYIAAACGKPEYMAGNMHPVYPEVRRHWLDLVSHCLERGVDGINFRVANHTRISDHWDYGYNEPVLDASDGKTDYPTISRINGNAYTQFLREARELIKDRGKGLTIHLHAGMLITDERGRLPVLPPNFEWQWETWVKEIADALELRGSWTLRPWNLQKALDIFSNRTRAAGKPFYYQSDFHTMTNDEGRKHCKSYEVDLVKSHPGIDGFVLYETANYTHINHNGAIEVKPFLREALKPYYHLNK